MTEYTKEVITRYNFKIIPFHSEYSLVYLQKQGAAEFKYNIYHKDKVQEVLDKSTTDLPSATIRSKEWGMLIPRIHYVSPYKHTTFQTYPAEFGIEPIPNSFYFQSKIHDTIMFTPEFKPIRDFVYITYYERHVHEKLIALSNVDTRIVNDTGRIGVRFEDIKQFQKYARATRHTGKDDFAWKISGLEETYGKIWRL